MISENGTRMSSGSGIHPGRIFLKAPGGAMNLTNCRFYDRSGQMILSGIAAAAITIPLTTSYQSLKDLVCALIGGQAAWDAIASSVAGFEADSVTAQVDVSLGQADAVVPSLYISTGRPLRLGHGIPPEKQSMMGATVNVSGEVETAMASKMIRGTGSIAAVGGFSDAVACAGMNSVAILKTSANSASPTLVPQVSYDNGVTWSSARAYSLAANDTRALPTSTAGMAMGAGANGVRLFADVFGATHFRIQWSTTSATEAVTFQYGASSDPFIPPIGSVDTSGRLNVAVGNITPNQTNGASVVSTGFVAMGEARSLDIAAYASGQGGRPTYSLLGKQVTLPHALPAQTWSYAAATGGITNTTPVAAQAAPGAGIRHYVKGLQLVNQSTTAVEVEIRSGTTALWRAELDADSGGAGFSVVFDPPLRAAANEAINIYCSGSGKVFANLQGYSAAE